MQHLHPSIPVMHTVSRADFVVLPPQQRRCRIVGLEISQTSLERAKEVTEVSLKEHGPLTSSQIELYDGDFFALPETWTRFYATDGDGSSSRSGRTLIFEDIMVDFALDCGYFKVEDLKVATTWKCLI